MEPWAKELIGDLSNEILVSAASIYEISLKVRNGKLPEAVEFESDLIVNIESRLGKFAVPHFQTDLVDGRRGYQNLVAKIAD
jgi:PIN domain nuclease of toxin-antitoxin system